MAFPALLATRPVRKEYVSKYLYFLRMANFQLEAIIRKSHVSETLIYHTARGHEGYDRGHGRVKKIACVDVIRLIASIGLCLVRAFTHLCYAVMLQPRLWREPFH